MGNLDIGITMKEKDLGVTLTQLNVSEQCDTAALMLIGFLDYINL